MVQSGCLIKYSASNLHEGNVNTALQAEGKFSNSDALLGFVAQSLSSSSVWTRRPKDVEKNNGLKNIYKYANFGEAENEKTSMCRIAELARYHKVLNQNF